VVESPADIYAIEQTGQYSGRYFVLMGHLSPLDGIGRDIVGCRLALNGRVGGKDHLGDRLRLQPLLQAIVLATNPTVEGEATANYIAELCAQYGVDASRIAHGVQAIEPDVIRPDAVERRQVPHQHEVAAGILPGLLNVQYLQQPASPGKRPDLRGGESGGHLRH
jgi:hypothetical protein